MSVRLGEFRLIREIGSGSFSRVYECQDEKKQKYALKVILNHKMADPSLLISEFNIMRAIGIHPNLCALHKTFVDENRTCLALEYCPGGDLARFIKTRGIVSSTIAIDILLQLCNGLAFLHSKSIIHRDLKPANILLSDVTANPKVKISDFGLSVMNDAKFDMHMRQTQCGTPYWLSPERLDSCEYYSYPADVWSLGIIAYELQFGHLPFRGTTPKEVLLMIKSEKIKLPQSETGLASLLPGALSVDPSARPSAYELHQLLLPAVVSAAVSTSPIPIVAERGDRLDGYTCSFDSTLLSYLELGFQPSSPPGGNRGVYRDGGYPQLLSGSSSSSSHFHDGGGMTRRTISNDSAGVRGSPVYGQRQRSLSTSSASFGSSSTLALSSPSSTKSGNVASFLLRKVASVFANNTSTQRSPVYHTSPNRTSSSGGKSLDDDFVIVERDRDESLQKDDRDVHDKQKLALLERH